MRDAAPDGPITGCAASAECGDVDWCNPAGALCEPRGTTWEFEPDIYPRLRDACAGCHAAADPDAGIVTVFSGGPGAVHARLVAGVTSCAGPLCLSEPRDSRLALRLLEHRDRDGRKLLSDGYADPWLQRFLHWVAAGARRGASRPDAAPPPDAPTPDASPPPDAPPPDAPPPDAPPPDAPPPDELPPDAPPPDASPSDALADGPAPDALEPDTTPPMGGDVTAAIVDACGSVTVTLQQGADDRTAAADLRYEVCWSGAADGCDGEAFEARKTYGSPGKHSIGLSSLEGTTQYFRGRVVDLAGQASTPARTERVDLPTFLSWAAGGIGVTKTAQPGAYLVSWPTVSSRCPGAAPLKVQTTCAGPACSCATAADLQSATCSAASCDPISITVTASAGMTTAARSGSHKVLFSEASPVFTGCRGCHDGFGPTFSPLDVGRPSSIVCTGLGMVYITAFSPAQSMIWSAASTGKHLCGVNHTGGTMSATDQPLLRCWIEAGAQGP